MLEDRQTDEQRIISVFSILEWAEAFIMDRKARGLSPNTTDFYRKKLNKFIEFCNLNQVHDIQELNAHHIRQYLLWLETNHHNKGGVHAHFRVLRSFLHWYELENDLMGWANPIRKVKVKSLRKEPLEPADISAIKAMIGVCGNDFTGLRGKVILLMYRSETAQFRYFLIELEYRSIGLGLNLINLFADFLNECGYRGCYLWTTNELVAAASLYKQVGFKLTE